MAFSLKLNWSWLRTSHRLTGKCENSISMTLLNRHLYQYSEKPPNDKKVKTLLWYLRGFLSVSVTSFLMWYFSFYGIVGVMKMQLVTALLPCLISMSWCSCLADSSSASSFSLASRMFLSTCSLCCFSISCSALHRDAYSNSKVPGWAKWGVCSRSLFWERKFFFKCDYTFFF